MRETVGPAISRPVMSRESRRLAGILLIVFPSVIYGGVSLLAMLTAPGSAYMENPLRQNLFRAGHAHAGVLLVLSLVALRYVDDAQLSPAWKGYVRHAVPAAAILMPVAFFLSIASPSATAPNRLIWLAYVGAVVLAIALFALGVGIVRTRTMP